MDIDGKWFPAQSRTPLRGDQPDRRRKIADAADDGGRNTAADGKAFSNTWRRRG